MLGKAFFHYTNLLQNDIDERNSLLQQFNGFRHNTQFLGQTSRIIVYIAAGIIVIAAALAGLLILLQP
ncbi:MAG: hypothetical protein K8S15_06760 [Candidatus Aegiribacteria sp.]|nr:hypothetical protein [Candidatus Aegiribacteria sp.]